MQNDHRFEFGANWRQFLSTLNDDRIAQAQRALGRMIGTDRLDGKRFLDVGSGSGLSSLAAKRMGAALVHSFDYDPNSVGCTEELRRRYHPDDPAWVVERGDALDESYLEGLGTFDVVYSWGVLHHTGDMWRALDNVSRRVKPGGTFFVAIYNDQGGASVRWLHVKRFYNRMPAALRPLVSAGVGLYTLGSAAVRRVLYGRAPLSAQDEGARQDRRRGMSIWYDVVDWAGGYPFEVAKPERILDFYRQRGFVLDRLTTCGGKLGCNEYVFTRNAAA